MSAPRRGRPRGRATKRAYCRRRSFPTARFPTARFPTAGFPTAAFRQRRRQKKKKWRVHPSRSDESTRTLRRHFMRSPWLHQQQQQSAIHEAGRSSTLRLVEAVPRTQGYALGIPRRLLVHSQCTELSARGCAHGWLRSSSRQAGRRGARRYTLGMRGGPPVP